MTTSVIIPTKDEIVGIKKILPQVNLDWADEWIVVDGNSTDGTIEEAEKMGFKVIQQTLRGHGGAIISGVNATTADNILIFGPDGNHEPEEIPLLIAEMAKKNVDQIMCSRFAPESINLDAGAIDTFGNIVQTPAISISIGQSSIGNSGSASRTPPSSEDDILASGETTL